jgi:hypothetical protein
VIEMSLVTPRPRVLADPSAGIHPREGEDIPQRSGKLKGKGFR